MLKMKVRNGPEIALVLHRMGGTRRSEISYACFPFFFSQISLG